MCGGSACFCGVGRWCDGVKFLDFGDRHFGVRQAIQAGEERELAFRSRFGFGYTGGMG